MQIPTGSPTGDDMPLPDGRKHAMETVWENGKLLRDWTFAEVRARSG
jgi:nicotinamide phosphoribosyltransferase